MKGIILIIAALTFFTPVFSQPIKTGIPGTHQEIDYLKRSIKQKKIATAMLFGGVILVGTSTLFLLNTGFDSDNLSTKYRLIIGTATVGGFSVLGSIPLFVAAKRNKVIALNSSAGLKIQYRPVIAGATALNKPYPALVFKLTF